MVQEVRTRIMSAQGDWVLYPDLGANLYQLIGEPNIPLTAEDGKSRIIASLSRDGFVNSSDISIKYIPYDQDKLLYRLVIAVRPTDENEQSESVRIDIVYNYTNGNLHVL